MASNAMNVNIKTRKVKKGIPECKKDFKYYKFRKLNTQRAAKSRQKKKDADIKFKQLLIEVEETNKKLKQKVIDLKEELNMLIYLYKTKQNAYNDVLFFESIIINDLI